MNQNPTDTNGNQLVVGYYYKVDQVSPLTQYVGLFGQSLRFKILNSDPEFFILRTHNFHPENLGGQAGGRRKSKSKKRKTKRRKSRKNKSIRR